MCKAFQPEMHLPPQDWPRGVWVWCDPVPKGRKEQRLTMISNLSVLSLIQWNLSEQFVGLHIPIFEFKKGRGYVRKKWFKFVLLPHSEELKDNNPKHLEFTRTWLFVALYAPTWASRHSSWCFPYCGYSNLVFLEKEEEITYILMYV